MFMIRVTDKRRLPVNIVISASCSAADEEYSRRIRFKLVLVLIRSVIVDYWYGGCPWKQYAMDTEWWIAEAGKINRIRPAN